MNWFKDLIHDTYVAFDKSDIRKRATELDRQWAYSICATKITMNRPMIVGFNWGAKQGERYQPQDRLPVTSFNELSKKPGELGSLINIVPYLRKHVSNEDLNELVQTNYCFFRSPNETDISENDLNLSRPLFFRFMDKVSPSLVIAFSSRFTNDLINNGLLANVAWSPLISFKRGQRIITYKAMRAQMAKTHIPLYSLPHPMFQMSKNARDMAWAFCFDCG